MDDLLLSLYNIRVNPCQSVAKNSYKIILSDYLNKKTY